jgi:ABC-2 type transport system permease protein
MNPIGIVFRRELASYFATPVAYVFIVVFLVMAGVFAFYFGGLFESNQASLRPFFAFHPFLYLFLVPAVAMRLWAEERRSGSIELLLTLPVTMLQAVIGKFLAAWAFLGVGLLLTLPLWFTVSYLGDPDHGVILAGYFGSFMMAGAFLSIGSCLSAFTRNQVVAFILTVTVCFFFVMAGFPVVLELMRAVHIPQLMVDAIASLSIWAHFEAIQKGVIELRDFVYFALMIGFWLYASAVVIDLKKAD